MLSQVKAVHLLLLPCKRAHAWVWLLLLPPLQVEVARKMMFDRGPAAAEEGCAGAGDLGGNAGGGGSKRNSRRETWCPGGRAGWAAPAGAGAWAALGRWWPCSALFCS